jgi:hypothetical protein
VTCRRVLGRCRLGRLWCAAALCAALAPAAAAAQERPYFITYGRHLEEPDSFEASFNPVYARQRGGGDFLAGWLELEYGVKGWWTTELYLDGQGTRRDSTVATGWRWENRVRPLLHEHWLNPVLYLEYEDIDGADKTLLEVVGHDVQADHAPPNRELRRERKRELEAKLILGSSLADWDLSGNFIAEKNLAGALWEFGYAAGCSRPLALAARPDPCTFCPENFTAGVEMYGGLGDAGGFGLAETSHYLAPVVAWSLPNGTTLRLSPTFGLNRNSHRFLLRFGVSYEIPGLWRRGPRRQGGGAGLR